MSTSLRLDLRQSQSLVMTPQLQQAIKLLQLGNLELTAYVEQELEQNPFLEKRSEEAAPEPERPPESGGDDGSGVLSGTPDFVTDDRTAGDAWSGSDEDGWNEVGRDAPLAGMGVESVADSFGYVGRGGSMSFDDDGDSLEARASRPKSLKEHLVEQMLIDLPDGPERLIAHHLIDLVDDTGYIRGDLDDIVDRIGCDGDLALEVLKKLQRFDPPGVCARSLKECLALQLSDRDRLDPAMEILLDHLDRLARADVAQLHRLCGVLPEDIRR